VPKISFQLKIILSIVFFTLFVSTLEKSLIHDNVITQFQKIKLSKNKLLIDTISPILSLNFSLGLEDANRDYLAQITKQNADLVFLKLTNKENIIVYSHTNTAAHKAEGEHKHYSQSIIDPITLESIGHIEVHFSSAELQELKHQNQMVTLKVMGIVFTLLLLFILFIRREFKDLQRLSEHVLSYDPARNNFSLTLSKSSDEVGIVQNAIVSMVCKLNTYTATLDEMNRSLEEKVFIRTKELEEANRKLLYLATIDPLTQIANRRHFEAHFQEMWALSLRKNLSISIIMCDIDFFKKINDTYGHQVGDAVLKGIAQIIKSSLQRSSDLVARYGGEEFVILLYDTDKDKALESCKKIQQNIRNTDGYVFQNIKTEPVTMSFGISTTIANKDFDQDDLIKNADIALYKAKNSGRDCIVSNESL